MFEGLRQQLALRRWKKSVLGGALQQHGQDYFWGSAPFSYLDEATKIRHCVDLHLAAMTVLADPNPLIAAREKLANYVLQFAELMVSGMNEESKRDHPIYSDSPYISGQLYHHLDKISDKVDEIGRYKFQNPDISFSDLRMFCVSRASLLLLYCNGLNLVLLHIEGTTKVNSDWYRAFTQAMLVWFEDKIRSDIGIESLLPHSTDGLVYGTFLDQVLSGDPDPLYTWTKLWPDRYLWGHGPRPTS